LQGDLGPLGGHRRGQLRDNRADVPREVLKVAALSAALTIGRPGAALLAQPFPPLGGTT
jgi:hypothetical protein